MAFFILLHKNSNSNNGDQRTIVCHGRGGGNKEENIQEILIQRIQRRCSSQMSNFDLVKLFNARFRRRFYRGLKKKPLILIKKLRKAKKEASDENKKKPEAVKTHLRNMIIVPEMIGSIVGVHNGNFFNEILIKPEMIGHYLAEFSITCKKVNHYRPRICGCFRWSTRFIPLR